MDEKPSQMNPLHKPQGQPVGSQVPDARQMSNRLTHYSDTYRVVSAKTVGKPFCFDVSLIAVSSSGNSAKQKVRTIKRWAGRESWFGKPGSPFDLAIQEAHDLHDRIVRFRERYR